ncbi:hypothetical protein [Flagellimonas sp. 2504JD1-5]
MKNSLTKKEPEKTVEKFHWESLKWKSHFLLMEDELLFINRLLNSYVFEPNTPNLFERLMDYKSRIKKVEEKKNEAKTRLVVHESELGGLLECLAKSCDKAYQKEHESIKAEVMACIEDFQNLKLEIFNYAGGILRKNKPTH